MKNKERKDRATALIAKVDAVLWKDWDPIGLNENSDALGEYSSYAPSLVTLLLNQADEIKIAQHLASIETHSMGISSGIDHCRYVARKLLALFKEHGFVK